jgi:hypothetical protein
MNPGYATGHSRSYVNPCFMGNLLLSRIQSCLSDIFQSVDLLNNKSDNVKATSGIKKSWISVTALI